ncbi:hypothetical protein Droror1_Dr00010984 [Drosera rotundifolia]
MLSSKHFPLASGTYQTQKHIPTLSIFSSDMNYNHKKVRSRCHGFRISKRRISIRRLRAKFLYIVRSLNDRWRRSCIMIKRRIAMSSIRICSGSPNKFSKKDCRSESKRHLIVEDERVDTVRMSSIMHTNSFYTEAIADCLEFIKRSSASVDDRDS